MQDNIPTVWGEAIPFCPETTTSRAFSSSVAGEGLAIQLDRLSIDLQGEGKPLSDASILTFRAPLSVPEDQPLVGYRTDMRYFVAKSAGAQISIHLSLGGIVRTLTFPRGEGVEGDNCFEEVRLPDDVPATPVPTAYHGAVLVFVERDSSDESALVTIDSLDIVAILAPTP